MSDPTRAMLAKIEAGVRLESAEEMTAEYRENLVHLLTMQADSELAGGYGYVPWITKAPTVEEKHVVAQIVKDELRHATVMYGLLGDLGFDVETHVRKHDEIFNRVEQARLRASLVRAAGEIRSGGRAALDLGSGTGNVTAHLLDLGFQVTWCHVTRHFLGQRPVEDHVFLRLLADPMHMEIRRDEQHHNDRGHQKEARGARKKRATEAKTT